MTVASCIVPAFNEENRIAETVKALQSIGFVGEVTVVDDGSSDLTAKRAGEAGARVVCLMRNLGKAEAIRLGLEDTNTPIVCFVDADLGATAAEMEKLIAAVLQGRADMAVAGFQTRGPSGFGVLQMTSAAGVRALGGVRMAWPLSGQRAMWTQALREVGIRDRGFGLEVGLDIDWLRHGFSIVEVPTAMSHRKTGRDIGGFIHRGRQFWAVSKAILSRVMNGGGGQFY